MNYRKFYLETLKLDLPKHIQIHHLDGDKCNNNLDNLVAIPRYLHLRYHYFKNQILLGPGSLENIINVTPELDHYYDFNKHMELMLKLRPSYIEIKKWVDIRGVRAFSVQVGGSNDVIELDEYNIFGLKTEK